MRLGYLKELEYIYWAKESDATTLTIREMQDKEKFLAAHGQAAESKTKRSDWLADNAYRIERKGYYQYLYVHEDNKYNVYVTHMYNDSKNLNPVIGKKTPGLEANQIENELFKELNGVSERAAFGYCDRALLNKCVPKQLYYINPRYIGKNIPHAGKADYKSHYPANMRGPMPDWKTRQLLRGTVKPDPVYKFAFYLKSGHSAEYGVYDTHDWMKSHLNDRLFGERLSIIPPGEDVTVLCKPSKYTFDSTIDTLYAYKERGELIKGVPAKAVLVCAIGYKHLSNVNAPQNRLDHVATVALARSNQKMLELYEANRADILQIIVDGVIYKGAHKLGTENKTLGCLHQEITDCPLRMRGTNQYIFVKDGKCLDYASSGFDDNIRLETLEDIELWRRKSYGQEDEE